MGRKNYLLLFSFCVVVTNSTLAQRVLTEARLLYSVQAESDNANKNLEAAFTNTTQTVWLKSNMARVDFSAPLRQQSTIYNATTGNAVLLRETGTDKYQWNLDSNQWKKINEKWEGATYQETGETKEISNYLTRKILATLTDGSSTTIYYTPQLIPLAKGYDLLFVPLAGLPVQYEVKLEGLKVIYTLQSIQTGPIGPSRFDIPTVGYKIMEAPKEGLHVEIKNK